MAAIIKHPSKEVAVIYDEDKDTYSIWFGSQLAYECSKEGFMLYPDKGWTLAEILFAAIQGGETHEEIIIN